DKCEQWSPTGDRRAKDIPIVSAIDASEGNRNAKKQRLKNQEYDTLSLRISSAEEISSPDEFDNYGANGGSGNEILPTFGNTNGCDAAGQHADVSEQRSGRLIIGSKQQRRDVSTDHRQPQNGGRTDSGPEHQGYHRD